MSDLCVCVSVYLSVYPQMAKYLEKSAKFMKFGGRQGGLHEGLQDQEGLQE